MDELSLYSKTELSGMQTCRQEVLFGTSYCRGGVGTWASHLGGVAALDVLHVWPLLLLADCAHVGDLGVGRHGAAYRTLGQPPRGELSYQHTEHKHYPRYSTFLDKEKIK